MRDPRLGGNGQATGIEPHLSEHVAVMKHLEALKYWRTRQDAARDIVGYGSAAIPGLLNALYDQNVGTRLHAVDALVSIGDRRGQDGLIGALWDEHALVRQAAATGLGIIGTEHAVEELLRLLHHDDEIWVRKEATLALGRIAGREFGLAPRLVPILLNLSTDVGIVRKASLEALVTIGREAIPPLRDGLHNAQWIIRRTAAAALANIGELAIPTLQQALTSHDHGVKRIAAWALNRVV